MNIGVITNDETRIFQSQVIAGIRAYVEPHGYQVVVVNTGQPNTALDAINLDLDALAGLLVIANALADDALRTLYAMHKPISLISHQVKDSPIPAVLPDNAGGIIQLVNYLAAVRGCQRIAFIQGNLEQADGQERWQTFQQEMMRHNLPLDDGLILPGDFNNNVALRSTQALIASGRSFDALAAADYLMAITAMNALAAHGVRIPDDVCIVGFGDGPEAGEAGLTTVGVDVEKIGVHAAKQVLGQIEGLSIRGVTLIATAIIQRASC